MMLFKYFFQENSGLDARSKFYGVSAYICQDSDTTFGMKAVTFLYSLFYIS